MNKDRAKQEALEKAHRAEEETLGEAHLEAGLRQVNLMYVGLIGIGLVMVQPFLTAESLDLSAKICVVAFSVAIPLLAALLMVNWEETYRRRESGSVLVSITQVAAQMSAFVGVVAGFWHILWIAGAGVLAGGIVGLGVHSAGYARLVLNGEPTTQVGEEPEDSGS